LSNITKNGNIDDNGDWIANLRLSIDDVRLLYTYAEFYDQHSKNLEIFLSKEDMKHNEAMKSLLYAMILDYKFCEE